MKSLFEPESVQEILVRVEKLSPRAQRQWGKMKVEQMLAHTANALEMAMGTRPTKRVFIGRIIGPLIKKKYSDDSAFSKNSPTSDELKPVADCDFNNEKTRLVHLIRNFSSAGEAGVTKAPHPFFGSLTPEEWGKGMYKHLDHHLIQFAH